MARYEIVPELAALLDAPQRPLEELARGKRHRHIWRMWGDDEYYERCETCGKIRKVAVKQGSLF